ncbi:MAG: helix-turn-helix domain-containing protein [Ruminococcaceae bacterium]|nr:helix-turn-helix domain-containing protein [Oscillospiraceae bacterium]
MFKYCKVEKIPIITTLYSGFSTTHKVGYQYKGESHDFWEMVFVLKGKLQATAGEKVFVLQSGEAIVHSPMQFHALSCSQGVDATILVFSFAGKNIPPLQDKIYKISNMSELWDLYLHSQRAFYFDDIFFNGYKGDKSEGNKFVKALETFVMGLADNLADTKQVTTQAAKNYNMVINVLNQNIDKRLSVPQIAKLCNMSSIGLQKTFSHFANIGVMEYFNRLKVSKAKQMLSQGKSVKETAVMLGFYDPNYFSTVFKRVTGKTPKSFKIYENQ